MTPLPSMSASRAGHSKSMAEAKLALLYWVQSQLKEYVQHHIIATVQDFSRSWRSGLVFCLLVHRFDPALIPSLFTHHLDHITEKETWHTLLLLAFDIADQAMHIPKYLEPADLLDVDYPHEPSVMMYVSEMYKVMSQPTSQQHQLKTENMRLHDLSLLVSVPHIEHDITPPDSTREDDDELPSTPQPEFEQDVYQQLDVLSTLLSQQEMEPTQRLLQHTLDLIGQLDPTSQESQVLTSRYQQLRLEWETLSKKRASQQHESHYVNENDPVVSFTHQLEACHMQTHPLDGTQDMAQEAEQALSQLWMTTDETLRNQCITAYETTTSALALFKRGLAFGQLTTAIQDELGVVQHLLSNRGTSTVTDDLIQSLEQRIHVVNATIQGVRDEYQHDVLLYDTNNPYFDRFVHCIDDIEDRYEVVRDWVDQVRVWFVEAERIRRWIDQHIHVITERNENDTFNPVSRDLTITDERVMQVHEEHEKLKHEIDHFDSDDMNRLRAHVKMLTPTDQTTRQELTPADTSTIEITLTTLNMLNQLTHLLNKRSHVIELLLLRVKWEDLFGQAVQWIALTDNELDIFIKGKARWSEKEESQEEDIEGVIKTLVGLERKIADFDHGDYADVLDAYQEMETLKNEALPDYLEMRQLGFERAFEDLMKRSGFSRKVVEQLLSMMNTVEKFKELRQGGERLRHTLLQEHGDDDTLAEQVQAFKEDSARFITNTSTNIPYPSVPTMATAMGANDAQDNQITNENIRSTISAYSMSLALIADGLDQLLESRYQLLSLQQRADEAYESMARVKLWMEERIKLLTKSRFDIMLFAEQSPSNSTSTSSDPSPDVLTTFTTDEETHVHLEKERDGIAQRLYQMENDELAKLFETVRLLEYDVDASNAVSIDRDYLVNGVEGLEKTHQQLKEMLSLRGLQLDAFKKRMDWESQWSKTNSHLHTIARKLCDFSVKKARYDPAKEEKPSYHTDHENRQSFQFIQDRITELSDRHLTLLFQCYQEMLAGYTTLDQQVPDFVTSKQATLKLEYDDLRHLASYTSELMTQRATMTEFLMRTQDAQHEGEKIKEVITKRIRRIMVKEEEDGTVPEARVTAFKQEVKSVWQDCGKNMPFPVYSGNWLRSSTQDNTAGVYRSQVRAHIKSLLDKKMEELYALEKSIDQSMSLYRDADNMKSLVSQYEQEACQLGQWIHAQIESLKRQHIDVSAESFLTRGMNISDLKKTRLDMYLQVDAFGSKKVKTLHDQIAAFVEKSVQNKKNASVDVSLAARHLGEVMDHLSQLKRGLSDQAVTLEAASMRQAWEKQLQLGITALEDMNEQLREFTNKKNNVISQDELVSDHINSLQHDLSRLIQQKNKFEKSTMPGIQLAYDAFVEYFPKLSRPMATPDHLEARMESLSRTSIRFQENVTARSEELDFIKKRMRWEDTVKQALVYFSEQEATIDAFVEEKARWHTDHLVSDDDDDEAKLRNAWYAMYTDVQSYQQEVMVPLQHRFDRLVDEATQHYNNTSVALLPHAFMQKMQHTQAAVERTDYLLDFSNQVVSQRCLVSAFILRTAQLEQSAELIREEFIATQTSRVGLLENHTERLEKFKAGIQDVRQNLAGSIPYPVRSIDTAGSAKIKDETTNAVIQDTIEMRNTRLDELCISLQQLLASKERVSRRRLSLHAYKKQVEAMGVWMQSRRDLLEQTYAQDDVEKLKAAVSQAKSVEQAMKSNESVFYSLTTCFEKCNQAFQDKSLENEQDEESLDMTLQIEQWVKPTQDRITLEWNALLQQACEATKNRTVLLIQTKVSGWLTALEKLGQTMHAEEIKDDQHISGWSETLNTLEQEHQSLVSDVHANKDAFSAETTAHVDQCFQQGVDLMQSIQTTLAELQNDLYLDQLIAKYVHDITELERLVQAHMDTLHQTNQDHEKVDGDASSETRASQHQALVSKYKASTDTMVDLEDRHNDVLDQFNTITTQKDTFTHESLSTVTDKWKTLLALESNISALMTRSSQWMQHFDSLATIRQDLSKVQTMLEGVLTLSGTERDQALNTIDHQLDMISTALGQDVLALVDELTHDTINFTTYERQRTDCVEWKDRLQLALDHQLDEKDKAALMHSIHTMIHRLCEQCQVHLSKVKEHVSLHTGFTSWSAKDIQSTVDACQEVVMTTNSLEKSIQQDMDSLYNQACQDLVSRFDFTQAQVDEMMLPLSTAVTDLKQASTSESHFQTVSQKMLQYLLLSRAFQESVDALVSKLANQVANEAWMEEFNSQLVFIDENKKQLQESSQEMASFDYTPMQAAEQRQTGNKMLIASMEKDRETKYDTLMSLWHQSKTDMEKIKHRQQIVLLLKDLLLLVSDTTERVHALQLASEERELKDMHQTYCQTMDKKSAVLDSLMAKDEQDQEINTLKQRLEDKKQALHLLFSIKKKEASDEGDLSEFLAILSEFETHAALLSSAIEKASPHHSALVNNKFVKSDLQQLLNTLVAVYNKEKEISVDLLKKAGHESKKQFLGENDRVTESLAKAKKRWSQVSKAFAARERELHTCISNLDHEFFTKLAMAKNTKRVLPSVTRSTARHTFARPTFDDSSRRSSRTSISTSSSMGQLSRFAYVADALNPLDMQLGHILNSYPHRIPVRMIPDQVGKYWFGDENPRLVYCRILPSKLVMVRVGGGWVELSKFLRDHGLIDGIHSRPASSQEISRYNHHSQDNAPFQEGYFQALRSSSPSGRVTIRGGGGIVSTRSTSASSRPKSPLPGFVDGNKYISMDDAGNHVVVKMKKADKDAKTPVIKKKSTI